MGFNALRRFEPGHWGESDMLKYILLSLLVVLVTYTTEEADAQDLVVSTDYAKYELGDIIQVNIANTGNSTAIFNYEIINEQENIFPKKCISSNDTSNILAGQTRTLLLDTKCVGSHAHGNWTVVSKLTHDGKPSELFSSASFDIVMKIFSCGSDDCTISTGFLDRNNTSEYLQNNTGWNQKKFLRSALYLFSDSFGNIVIPITTDGSYSLDIKTKKISFLDIVENHERLYMYISGINKNDPTYSKTFDMSYLEIFPEEKNMITISFPNMFNLDGFSSDLRKSDLGFDRDTYDNTVLIDGPVIPDFGNSQMFTYDFFFIKQLEYSTIVDNTHTHTTIPKDRPHLSIFSSFNGTFADGVHTMPQRFSHYDYIFPPLKQTQNGVEPQDILCKEHLKLVLHPDGSPSCVKPESISKLIQYGWTTTN